MKNGNLKSARGTAAELGVSTSTLIRFYRDGIIDAEIAEGKTMVFDVEKCRATLAKRAREKRSVRNRDFMIPTC